MSFVKSIQILFLLLFLKTVSFSQNLPDNRRVDWTLAGVRDTTTTAFTLIDLSEQNLVGDGVTPNDNALAAVLSSLPANGAILYFPGGNFLFNEKITLPSNTVLKGKGAESTTLTMDLGGSDSAINITGTTDSNTTALFTATATKDSQSITVDDATSFIVGDWVQIIQDDSNLVTSSWALRTVGQIMEIESINNSTNTISFKTPFRIDFDISREPYIQKITPTKNVGVECLKIERVDDTAPQQTSNVFFSYAVNSWVKNIESFRCNYAHVEARLSSNISISDSYLHEGFDYGGGGRAYGVMFHLKTNECRAENNIFRKLRHGMIIQAGANGNVFAYNYSIEALRVEEPTEYTGDMLLHGNYPFANLFEQNVGQNMIVDNSHGPNGPNNTYFRNRGELIGFRFTATNSPQQNIIGNEITYLDEPYSLYNYNILGADQFEYGNNDKGTIVPDGTENLPTESYAYSTTPDFLTDTYWAAIGTPNELGSGTIPAKERYTSGDLFLPCANAIILSAEGLDLLATYTPIGNMIKWEISEETSYTKFDIERSTDGVNFQFVSRVERNPITSNRHYAYLDEGATCEDKFYRIKQINEDESFYYSNIVELLNNCAAQIITYPNPVQDVLTIMTESDIDKIRISNSTGNLVKEEDVENAPYSLSLEQLNNGIYFISFYSKGDLIETKTILKLP